MRLIGTLFNENHCQRLSSYLKRKGIENRSEAAFDAQTGFISYHLWVSDEDRLSEASEILARFQKNPSSPEFDPPVIETLGKLPVEPPTLQSLRTPVTMFFLSLCVAIYLLNVIQEWPLRREGLSEGTYLVTPIEALFLFDLPPIYEKLEAIIEKVEIAPDQKIADLPPEVKAELKEVEQTPYWRGFYDWFFLKIKGKDTTPAEGPLFYQIRQGEVWRLFSPVLLHGNLLHILFNMIWLWVLGRPIEQRIGALKTLILTLAAGIGANVAQYLMSGPFFLGYSGIVMGLAGFTWMRERIAPWEGYPLQRSTILFLLFYIAAMLLLQSGSFLFQLFSDKVFMPNIANTAHIAGALIGALLGRFPYFAWRLK